MTTDWKSLILGAYIVKQQVAEADRDHLWPHHMPEVAAAQRQILEAESVVGHLLDEKYKSFLLHANGWQGFFQNIDLFGTDDLIESVRMTNARKILAYVGDLKSLTGFSIEELLPIGVSRNRPDVFVLVRPNAANPGSVLWLAGSEVERYRHFVDFFKAMIDYNKVETIALSGQS